MNGRRSTIGRPRVLTDEQVRRVLEWHAAVVAWQAQRPPTLIQLARELGVVPATLYNVVKLGGLYKKPEPKRRREPR